MLAGLKSSLAGALDKKCILANHSFQLSVSVIRSNTQCHDGHLIGLLTLLHATGDQIASI